MKEKVANKLETRAAELVIIAMTIVVLLSSCGSTSPHHAPGITPLNKQYRMNCN
jgi:hypothetical protein